MAKKKEIDKNIEELNKSISSGKAVLGVDETLKNLRRGNVAKLFLCSNISDSMKDDLIYYTDIAKTEVVELNYPNDELGALCKKPFAVAVISILK
ncbi:50S ribosomal protein L30 [Candidatus Woesearchaeota archaeon]|jgi:ribosomal protein L30E|nr:50S ribosomal protein L30 [Candidatus Woesearchaeota archaeon]